MALTLALGACSLVPDYSQPTVAAPADWRNQSASVTPAAVGSDEAASVMAQAGSDKLSDHWWTAYGNDELDRMVETARNDNHDLLAAMRRIDQARAQSHAAAAPLFPTVEADAGSSRSGNGRTSDVSVSYNAGLSVGYELDLWGKNRAALEGADASFQSSVYDAAATDLVLQDDVVTTYLTLLSLGDRLKVAQANLKDSEDTLNLVEIRYKEGAASALDVAQQRQQVASTRATIPSLQNQYDQNQAALALLLGLPPASLELEQASLDSVKLPGIAAGLPSTLLERRPDLRKADADLRAANAQIGVTRADFLPTIQLTGSGGLASDALTALFQPESALYNLAASLVAPLFDGGLREANYDQSVARFKELAETYQQTALTAFRDVEVALAAQRSSADQEAALQESADQAQAALTLANLLYREGAADLLTVLDAQRAQLQAQDSLVQARLARLQAVADLAKAMGGGWQDTQMVAGL
ncbi:MAG TPA: efflux transporter outer membrane subunit [Hypericibacter adhaerens]|uniref:efflux transporter outer membrane subunit n=1 Tax=Hypericibacter adhaerens TaxID=2602016 RepID=UPI002CB65B29|nr:efflux transporter outer membrane subunit [Hypericibacter adhaerens]HWA46142.1 efflux transporter outer membrane subunit [Hypericibacter adhaerens]